MQFQLVLFNMFFSGLSHNLLTHFSTEGGPPNGCFPVGFPFNRTQKGYPQKKCVPIKTTPKDTTLNKDGFPVEPLNNIYIYIHKSKQKQFPTQTTPAERILPSKKHSPASSWKIPSGRRTTKLPTLLGAKTVKARDVGHPETRGSPCIKVRRGQ